jgi:transcriptional regulator with XRE-family HTH domain
MGGAVVAGRDSGSDGREGRLRFGRLLADALKLRSMKQEQLARLLGTTQSSISGWINGKYEPAAGTVFGIERALALEPGHLSRPLGYLPVDAVSTPVGVESAILQSAELDDDEKDALVAVYHVLAEHQGIAGTAASTARGRLTSAPPVRSRPRSVAGRR